MFAWLIKLLGGTPPAPTAPASQARNTPVTAEERAHVWDLFADGLSQKRMADETGLSRRTIARILRDDEPDVLDLHAQGRTPAAIADELDLPDDAVRRLIRAATEKAAQPAAAAAAVDPLDAAVDALDKTERVRKRLMGDQPPAAAAASVAYVDEPPLERLRYELEEAAAQNPEVRAAMSERVIADIVGG
ncbi:MAG: helix-turn-helix domain-containing protein, partial [Chloroflexi bacterium]|nr:helix-turn-helix domain-containing protein [Chloroflexota bacterium]